MKLFLPLLLVWLTTSTALSMAVVTQVAVIGATGRLGRLAVQQLVEQGIACKILVRKAPPTDAKPLTVDSSRDDVVAYLANLPGVSVVQGDVGNKESLQTLTQDCDACLALFGATRRSKISDLWRNAADQDPAHSKQVNYQGVLNLIDACRTTNCRRIVRITGKGEQPTSFFSIVINLLGSMAKAWNYQGEQALRQQTDVDYTIIRPGIMGDDDQGGKALLALRDNGGDLPVTKIAYADVASLCVQCLSYDNAARATLTAMTTETGEGASTTTSWEPLLAKVQPDTRVFPSDMLEQHYAAVRKTLWGMGAVVLAVGVALVRAVVFNQRESDLEIVATALVSIAAAAAALGILLTEPSTSATVTTATAVPSVKRRQWMTAATMGLLSSSLWVGSRTLPTHAADEEGLVSTERLADLLRAVPTFTIVDAKGVPFMVVGEDAKVTGYFFIDYQEAKRILQVANESADKGIKEAIKEDPTQATELSNPWKEARISTVPLDFAVTLISKSLYDRRSGGNYFQIAPSAEEIDNALAVTGKEDLAEGKVPLFYYENFTLPVSTLTETPQTPLYFQKKQLEDAYRKENGRSAKLPPVMVTELFALLLEMVKPGGTDTDLQNLVFVAPVSSAAAAQKCRKQGGEAAPFLIGQRNIVL